MNQPTKTAAETAYAKAQAEGKARHLARQAEKAGAIFVRSLDGYVISEDDLYKLIEQTLPA